MRLPDMDLSDAEATAALGRRLSSSLRAGDAVCLWGPLGAGKSTLARGMIRALTSEHEDVPSPTFTLVQFYDAPDFPIAHFDLYRITRPDEAFEIGLTDALDEGAALIEWPERLGRHLPHHRLDISLDLEGDGRRARLQPHGAWKDRTLEL